MSWKPARYRFGAVCKELGNQCYECLMLYSLVNATGDCNLRHMVIHSSAPQCWFAPASVARFSNCCAVRYAVNAQYLLCIQCIMMCVWLLMHVEAYSFWRLGSIPACSICSQHCCHCPYMTSSNTSAKYTGGFSLRNLQIEHELTCS